MQRWRMAIPGRTSAIFKHTILVIAIPLPPNSNSCTTVACASTNPTNNVAFPTCYIILQPHEKQEEEERKKQRKRTEMTAHMHSRNTIQIQVLISAKEGARWTGYQRRVTSSKGPPNNSPMSCHSAVSRQFTFFLSSFLNGTMFTFYPLLILVVSKKKPVPNTPLPLGSIVPVYNQVVFSSFPYTKHSCPPERGGV